jgi:fucokinase
MTQGTPMVEEGSMAFLQQAHRNNWQQYLFSLKGGGRRGWDVCVLTASDERQASMYRRQLDWRREAGLLPPESRFLVVPDAEGRRPGSGGATLNVLALLSRREISVAGASAPEDLLTDRHVLVIHSGGSSKRLPHCAAVGKLFARVPRVLPDGRVSTIFDEFLISLSGLAAEVPPGVLVASGDVLLVFDQLQLSFQRSGAIGVAAAAPVAMGQRHGVYVTGDGGHRVHAYLHKPAASELVRWGAVAADDTVQIDTGLVWWDTASVRKLVALASDPRVVPGPGAPEVALNLYGDLLLPLAQSTTLEDYLADTSDGPALPKVQSARRVLWDSLRTVPFGVERLQPAVFVHFGTSEEYWQMVAADKRLAWLCGWTSQAAAWSGPDGVAAADRDLVLANASLEGPVHSAGQPALVVDSRLSGSLSLTGPAVIAGVQTAQGIQTDPLGSVIYQLSLAGGRYATLVVGLADNPKLESDDSGATFMNRPWTEWLAGAGVGPETVWPGIPPAARTLWNAQLYPVTMVREDSLSLALPLQDPRQAPFWWRSQWAAAPRISLAESAGLADGDRILAELVEMEDYVAVRRWYTAIEAEGPAIAASRLLGLQSPAVARRAALAAYRLESGSPLLQMRGYKGLAEATGDAAWEERAFVTLAAAVQSSSHSRVPTRGAGAVGGGSAPSVASAAVRRGGVRVAAAARIDFGGGWTDTPPYSIERGGTVLNAALTLKGEYPLACEARWLTEPKLMLESRDIDATFEPQLAGEVLAYANPADPFALIKAALVMRGIIPSDCDPAAPVTGLMRVLGSGLSISTGTSIPRGSGLGTSSIMAGAVLNCLGRLLGNVPEQAELFDDVLRLEQMLTTGGGWQDQAGGLTGGIKLVTSGPGLPQRLTLDPLRLSSETEAELAGRLTLVYTGQQRLAKNLLRGVMSRWIGRERAMAWILEEIARLAIAMRQALEAGDVDGFGGLLGEHWSLNQRMDPGCSNPFIDALFAALEPHICGGKLAGAGGGGFAFVVARSMAAAERLPAIVSERFPGSPVAVWPSSVPAGGLRVQVFDEIPATRAGP